MVTVIGRSRQTSVEQQQQNDATVTRRNGTQRISQAYEAIEAVHAVAHAHLPFLMSFLPFYCSHCCCGCGVAAVFAQLTAAAAAGRLATAVLMSAKSLICPYFAASFSCWFLFFHLCCNGSITTTIAVLFLVIAWQSTYARRCAPYVPATQATLPAERLPQAGESNSSRSLQI